jgi:mannose-6-phosphate isomerase-like protein (cupin superfamily)
MMVVPGRCLLVPINTTRHVMTNTGNIPLPGLVDAWRKMHSDGWLRPVDTLHIQL